MYYFFCLILFTITKNEALADYATEIAEYYKLPILYTADDFDRCMWSEDQFNVYCFVNTLIKPDNTSELWHQIEQHSNDNKRHFTHDLLGAGICMRECENKLNGLTEEEKEELYVEKFQWRTNRKWSSDESFYQNTSEFRRMYNKVVNQCQNIFLSQYNLTGYSEVQVCNTNEEWYFYEYEFLDYLFIVIGSALIIIVVLAIFLDAFLNKEHSLNHYKQEVMDLPRPVELLVYFSIVRNWYRLCSPIKTEVAKDFKFVSTLRYFILLTLIMCHVEVELLSYPLFNPEFTELRSEVIVPNFSYWFNSLFQVLFVTSGVLFYKSYHQFSQEKIFIFKYFALAVIYRYVRYTPVYAFLILFRASVAHRWGFGTIYKYYGERDRAYCRKNWWSNLLYINNYVDPDHMCMPQSWFLAADFQLYVFGLFLFWIIAKKPKLKGVLLGGTIFLLLIAQFLVAYFKELDGIRLMTIELKRFFNVEEDSEKVYMTAYANGINFFIGILLSMLYFRWKNTAWNWAKHKLFIAIWYLWLPLMYVIVSFIAYLFIYYQFEKPSLWIALLAVFTNNVWGIGAIVFIAGFFLPFKSFIKIFFNSSTLVPFARLTNYSIVLYAEMTRITLSHFREPVDQSVNLEILHALGIFIEINFVAFLFILCVDYPIACICKSLYRIEFKQHGVQSKKQNSVEMCENNNTISSYA